jgi:hypothetical protein
MRLLPLSSLVLLAVSGVAMASAWDPSLEWRTIETEHWRITFHDGEARIAADIASRCEEIWSTVTTDLGHAPRGRVELVLVDPTDDANGYATRLPVNHIVMYVTAPAGEGTLGFYSGWNETILTHELTHIVHLDTLGGLPLLASRVFGQIVTINGASPGWIVEGLATFEETRRTEGGRGRSSDVDMIKRMTLLEGHLPPLGNMDGFQADPPGGNIRYLLGEDFVSFLARTRGEDRWRDFSQAYGRRLPFFLPVRQVFGARFPALHAEWVADLERRYRAQEAAVLAEGLTPSVLASDGEGDCGHPAFSPDGRHLAWACADRARGARVVSVELGADTAGFGVPEIAEERLLSRDRGATALTWTPDASRLLFPVIEPTDPWHELSDLYEVDLGTGKRRKITRGARVSDPTPTPDGRGLLVVVNGVQNNNLAILDENGRLDLLTHFADATQLSRPRYSPDGRWIAVSAWRPGVASGPGTRDLWVLDARGVLLRRLGHDLAMDRGPVFTPDGRTLVFSSDRTGISNLWAVDLESEALFQVTNVLGGAFEPAVSPDGRLLAWAEHTWNGEDIRLAPLDRATWRPRGYLAREPADGPPLPALLGPEEGTPLAPGPAPEPPLPTLDAQPYNPLHALFPPRYLMPSVAGSGGVFMGALGTGGRDLLGRYGYSGWGTWRSDNNFVGGGLSLAWSRWRPTVEAGAQVYSVVYNDLYEYVSPPPEGGPYLPSVLRGEHDYTDRRVRLHGRVQLPLSPYHSAQLGLVGQFHRNWDPIPEHVYPGGIPTRGFLGSLGGGWQYARTFSHAYSISPERGRRLSAGFEWFTPLLGSHVLDTRERAQPFEHLQVSADWREFKDLPWADNHVLAMRLSGGLSFGDTFVEGAFRLGGDGSEESQTVLPSGSRTLRGFSAGTMWGDTLGVGGLEYRFPIWRIDRGYGTFPLFLRSLHGAFFSEAGSALDRRAETAPELLVGAGLELHLRLVLAWGLPADMRLGYAFSCLGEGFAPGDLDGLYYGLGASF